MAKNLRFIENQNRKLFCDFFTTVRKNSDYWVKNEDYWCEWVSPDKKMYSIKAKLVGIKKIKDIKEEWLLVCDTGYEDWLSYLKKIYKDFDPENMVVLLFKKIKKEKNGVQE